ncbi:MAG: hypothetical protein QNJ15_06295 [Erythrobacter sp.]|nr:hypothetical protein [Erythrobacter sp.]
MNEKAIQESGSDRALSRRQFGAVTGVAAVAAATPGVAHAAGSAGIADLVEKSVSVSRANGVVAGFFIQPAKGRHPAVISWRKGEALGQGSRNMARRLAKQGYAVLVLDRDSGNADAIEGDADAALKWLEAHPQVDEKRIGTPEWAVHRLESGTRN